MLSQDWMGLMPNPVVSEGRPSEVGRFNYLSGFISDEASIVIEHLEAPVGVGVSSGYRSVGRYMEHQ